MKRKELTKLTNEWRNLLNKEVLNESLNLGSIFKFTPKDDFSISFTNNIQGPSNLVQQSVIDISDLSNKTRRMQNVYFALLEYVLSDSKVYGQVNSANLGTESEKFAEKIIGSGGKVTNLNNIFTEDNFEFGDLIQDVGNGKCFYSVKMTKNLGGLKIKNADILKFILRKQSILNLNDDYFGFIIINDDFGSSLGKISYYSYRAKISDFLGKLADDASWTDPKTKQRKNPTTFSVSNLSDSSLLGSKTEIDLDETLGVKAMPALFNRLTSAQAGGASIEFATGPKLYKVFNEEHPGDPILMNQNQDNFISDLAYELTSLSANQLFKKYPYLRSYSGSQLYKAKDFSKSVGIAASKYERLKPFQRFYKSWVIIQNLYREAFEDLSRVSHRNAQKKMDDLFTNKTLQSVIDAVDGIDGDTDNGKILNFDDKDVAEKEVGPGGRGTQNRNPQDVTSDKAFLARQRKSKTLSSGVHESVNESRSSKSLKDLYKF